MSNPSDSLPRHKNDFDRVYNVEDPSPYFTALRPSDYRMPAVLAGALKDIHRPLCVAREAGDTLTMLDFACGYGAVGALLRHDISMPEIYAWYGERHWRPTDARRYWASDVAFFAARRAESVAFEIGGIDIAGIALEYAATQGFLDRTFHENLIDHVPSDGLKQFLRGVDLIVESGAVGDLLPVAFARILNCCDDGSRPWFLYSPRPDVDWASLNTLWDEHGYRTESLGSGPVRYRKPLAVQERAETLRITRALGKPDEAVIRDGYLLVDMMLARPMAHAGTPPITCLRRSYD